MEPPTRPVAGRRSSQKMVSANFSSSNDHFSQQVVPELTTESGTKDFSEEIQLTERVGMDWDQPSSAFQIEAECIETKIITTTTTTKRSYPPLQVRQPRSLEQLDAKEYPLANQPLPEELVHFSYTTGVQASRKRHGNRSAVLAVSNSSHFVLISLNAMIVFTFGQGYP